MSISLCCVSALRVPVCRSSGSGLARAWEGWKVWFELSHIGVGSRLNSEIYCINLYICIILMNHIAKHCEISAGLKEAQLT